MKTILYGISKVVLTTFLVASITFALLHIMSGSPFTGNKSLPPAIISNLEAKYHLNEPFHVQYFLYISGLLHGDLGPSLKYVNRTVNEILFSALPVSLTLGLSALIISIPCGILFGIISAIYAKKFIGNFTTILILVGISLPNFLISALFINFFGLKLKIFPVALWESPAHMVLPVITLSFLPLAYIARITRAQMLEQLSEEYIKTALAKGLPFTKIIFKHAFKNCLISIITVTGPIIAILITGSFVIEYIFAIPGMGRHFITAFTNRDYFLITGTAIVFSFIFTQLMFLLICCIKKLIHE